ncbi:LuxE/PaaK family acyltransferase [Dinghuibacter silviterrae]|uniref:Acyl-protein synthetase LuxE n=1 Tax=Dinghuibacter silviterrae TaxID=1539049 RepID=A0A4R8DTP4_9BACT|nr:acyl transferase [Dinghuibacter silviterrae]TDX00805.1 acyl-protein synthetase LuxE [Dinghuibacter silviterrae]
MFNVSYEGNIFQAGENSFEDEALALFRFQSVHNPLYRDYIRALGVDPGRVNRMTDIPFLPIRFFKTHTVTTTSFDPGLYFESSGTTGSVNSRHWVKDPGLYERSFVEGFRRFYGEPKDWCILGLLPNYLERGHSSLVYMVDHLVRLSGHPAGGFYLYEHERLAQQLDSLEKQGQQTLLIGVTFGLLDFAQEYALPLRHTVVMETGGMKGRREEWTRDQVHSMLRERLGVDAVHSEYGMTELLSQGYSKGGGIFHTVPWMRLLVREEDDPLAVRAEGKGVLNVIDLANVYSCAFIATEDLGNIYPDGGFEVLGRVDNSDIRGCSLLLTM